MMPNKKTKALGPPPPQPPESCNERLLCRASWNVRRFFHESFAVTFPGNWRSKFRPHRSLQSISRHLSPPDFPRWFHRGPLRPGWPALSKPVFNVFLGAKFPGPSFFRRKAPALMSINRRKSAINPEIASIENNHKGGAFTGGYGFGYVSDMYPSPFWYVSNSHFDIENTEKDPENVHRTQRFAWRTCADVSSRYPPFDYSDLLTSVNVLFPAIFPRFLGKFSLAAP